MDYLTIASLVAGLWATVNGVLHDVFVIKAHKGPYNRDLLRLLMDGHVLVTCGVMYLIAFIALKQGSPYGVYLCIVASISLLVYCAMIFPFLKSVVTTVMNLAVLVMAIVKLLG